MNKQELIEKIKQMRLRVDSLYQTTYILKPLYPRYVLEIQEQCSGEQLDKIREQFIDFVNGDRPHIITYGDITIEPKQVQQFPELLNTCNELFLAKSWLGKFLALLGEDSPYKNDGQRNEVKDIEPTADTSRPIKSSGFHIKDVDLIRETISSEIKSFLDFMDNINPYDLEIKEEDIRMFHLQSGVIGINIFTHLTQARFYLGAELARIREEELKKQNNETVS